MEELQESLATEIRRLRNSLHIDQETLAVKVGVTRSSISNIEASRQAVSLEMFVKLADALNQDPSALLTVVRHKTPVTVSQKDIKGKNVDENVLTTIQTTLNKSTSN